MLCANNSKTKSYANEYFKEGHCCGSDDCFVLKVQDREVLLATHLYTGVEKKPSVKPNWAKVNHFCVQSFPMS